MTRELLLPERGLDPHSFLLDVDDRIHVRNDVIKTLLHRKIVQCEHGLATGAGDSDAISRIKRSFQSNGAPLEQAGTIVMDRSAVVVKEKRPIRIRPWFTNHLILQLNPKS